MTTINKLNRTVDPTLLREAMKELGAAYGIKDKNSFVQLLLDKASTSSDGKLHGDEVEEFDTNPALKELADAIISLQGNGKWSYELIQAIKDYCSPAGAGANDKIAKLLMDQPKDGADSTFMSITSAGSISKGEVEKFGFLRDRGVDDIITDMGQVLKEDNTRKAVSVIEFHNPLLNFSNRDSAAAQIFLQALPSIEISKAVPYFDMKAIVKGDPTVANESGKKDDGFKFGNGISIYKFLSGERIETEDTLVKSLVEAIPADMMLAPLSIEGKAGEKPDSETQEKKITVAGMEVFTAPQTLNRGDHQYIDLNTTDTNYGPGATPSQIPYENKVLDKFRPFMTVESFNVQVTPATGMLATKSAEVKVKLHDKTRLNQVIPFISPAKLGICDIQIEWGWSHPETRPEVNPYGALINSMRCKELWGVMNSSYTFTPEGQVDITLKLFSKGAQRASFELISNNSKTGEHPIDTLKKIITAIRTAVKGLKKVGYTLNEEMGAPDVLGKASSVSGLLSLDDKARGKITKFINGMQKKKMNKESRKAWEGLGEGWNEAKDSVTDFQQQLKDGLLKEIDAACSTKKIDGDPYLVVDSKTAPKGFAIKGDIYNINPAKYVSLGKLLLQLVAKPLLATGKFEEIQMVFYPMNEFAMFARNLNVAQYPINKAKIKQRLVAEIKKNPSITIQKLLNLIKRTFVNFPGDDIYGMSKAYSEKPDDDGKYKIKESFTKDEKAKQKFSVLKSEILKLAYPGEGAERRFKKPSIQMWVECVQHEKDPSSSILRLHFFDKACTSYSSYAQLWASTSSNDLGIIGKYSNSKASVAKLEEKIAKAPKKEQKKLKEQLANRNARLSQHEKHAQRQIEIFQKNGLIKEIKIGDTTKYQIAGGPDQLRGILAANMPTLKYGTEFSGILNASLATNSNPQMETIHMQRQGGSSGTSDGFDPGLPMSVKPVTLSIDTFGCPYVNFGQQFFVDFQTNTTIDDIYAVTGVGHSLSPSEFKTQIKLTPLNKTGQYRSLQDSFDDATGVADQAGSQSE